MDGHQVCGDGHAYTLVKGTFDNPLPITQQQRAGLTLPFRAHLYNDAKPTETCKVQSVGAAGCYDDKGHGCGFTAGSVSTRRNDWTVAALDCHKRGYTIAGAEAGNGAEAWCSNALPTACSALDATACSHPCPGNSSESCGDAWVLQVLNYSVVCTATPKAGKVRLRVSWGKDGAAPTPIPAAVLGPALPAGEARRDALQRRVAAGCSGIAGRAPYVIDFVYVNLSSRKLLT